MRMFRRCMRAVGKAAMWGGCLLWAGSVLGASLPSGGRSILDSEWLDKAKKSGRGFCSIVPVSGMPFKEAFQVETTHLGRKHTRSYNVKIGLKDEGKVLPQGDTLVVRFFYKGVCTSETDLAHTFMMLNGNVSGKGTLINKDVVRFTPVDTWDECVMSFAIPSDANRSKIHEFAMEFFFGNYAQTVLVGGMDVRVYDSSKVAPDKYGVMSVIGNVVSVYQNKSHTVDVIWNDTHTKGHRLKVLDVYSQPEHGVVTHTDTTVTYKSELPGDLVEDGRITLKDGFYITVGDGHGNVRHQYVKAFVTPDFLDGTWNVGNEEEIFYDVKKVTAKGNPMPVRRFIEGTGSTIAGGRARFIHLLERKEEEGTLEKPLDEICYPFAKRAPDGGDMQPFGVYWDLPHEVSSSFCMPIFNSFGPANGRAVMPHSHEVLSYRMKFTMHQHTLNPQDHKARWYIKTKWTKDDYGSGNENGDCGGFFVARKFDPNAQDSIILNGQVCSTKKYRAAITADDTDADGYPDVWWWGDPTQNDNVYSPGEQFAPDKHINGGRIFNSIDSIDDFSVDIDLKPYFDWWEWHGWTTGGFIATLVNGTEMSSHGAHLGDQKGAGVMMFEDVDYWISVDRPAKNPIGNVIVKAGGPARVINISDVVDRLFYAGLKGAPPPELKYEITANSDPGLVKATLKGSELRLKADAGKSGIATLTVKFIDDFFRWDDIETFTVSVGDVEPPPPPVVLPPTNYVPATISYDFGSVTNTTLYDDSGNGFDAELMNGLSAASVEDEPDGPVMRFGGRGEQALCPLTEEVWDTYSIALWVNPSKADQVSGTSVLNVGSAMTQFQLEADEDTYQYHGERRGTFGDAIVGTWTHLAVVCDGTNTLLYTNGKLAETLYGVVDNTFSRIALGVNRSGNKRYVGLLDDVLIYRQALTAREVEAVYLRNFGSGEPPPPPPPPPPPVTGPTNTVSATIRYDFGSVTNTTLYDGSGNGFNAELFGGLTADSVEDGPDGPVMRFDGGGELAICLLNDEVWEAYTVALWANPSVAGQFSGASVFNNNSARNDFQIEAAEDAYTYVGGARGTLASAVVGTWTHLAVVCDGTNTLLYADGEWVTTLNDVADNNFGQIALGVNRGGRKRYRGLLDDVFIYRQALNAEQVKALYQRNDGPAPVDPDSDGDGLTDSQELLHGTRPDKPDTDGDGQSDGDEVAGGTNPTDPSDLFRIYSLRSGANNEYTIKWSSVNGNLYDVLRSTSLANLEDQAEVVAEDLAATPTTNVYTDRSATNSVNFYRIKLSE